MVRYQSKALTMSLLHPTHFSKPSLTFAGLRAYIPYSEVSTIGGLWEDFWGTLEKIEGKQGATCFGLSLISDKPQEGFDYLVAVLVDPSVAQPADVSVFAMPAQTYACFDHKGALTEVPALCQAILNDWAPQSETGINYGTGCSLIEHYREDFDPSKPGGLEIWTPTGAA